MSAPFVTLYLLGTAIGVFLGMLSTWTIRLRELVRLQADAVETDAQIARLLSELHALEDRTGFVRAAAAAGERIAREHADRAEHLAIALLDCIDMYERGGDAVIPRDHACIGCFPDGEALAAGFLCLRHTVAALRDLRDDAAGAA